MKGYFYESKKYDPLENFAVEEYLLHKAEIEQVPILFLWQNDNTVVIGRNQNVLTECNLEKAKEYETHIVRRLTGGGTVYHDLGNINFSVIIPSFFLEKDSTEVVLRALRSLKICAERNGRNDIILCGKKISGNAYYSNKLVKLHHGTILYTVNRNRMDELLSVSKGKLLSHGIKSVKSRVGDITSYYPNVQIDDIKQALKREFFLDFLIEPSTITIKESDIEPYKKRFSSDEWNMELIKEYDKKLSETFEWGSVTISIENIDNKKKIEIASDSLEPDLIERIKSILNQELIWDHIFEISNKEIVKDIINVYTKLIEDNVGVE